MMRREILSRAQKNLLEKMAGADWIKHYYLAGGTALALHLEHRKSIDFDFFTRQKTALRTLANDISSLGTATIVSQDSETLNAEVSKVKTSFFYYSHPLLEEFTLLDGIQVAGIADIAAMKIIAISRRGTKRDFIDIHAILKSGWNIESIFRAIESKFKDVSYNKIHLLKSLVYFDDAESDPMPLMLSKASWESVKKDLITFCAKKVIQ